MEIILSKFKEQNWFVSKLDLKSNFTVAIINDDTTIHSIWNERFKDIIKIEHNINLLYFSSPIDFINWYKNNKETRKQEFCCLCNFEFKNHSINGLNLISLLNIQKQSILVTSKYEKYDVLSDYEKIGIKLIPKELIHSVPIRILCSKIKVHAILIDDELIIHSIWKMSAKGRNIVCFNNPDLFLEKIEEYDSDTPIYIDSNLGEGKRGEEIAKEIFNKGFKEIYLATAYHPNYFPPMEWIKGIIGKSPPWMN
jgi:hypothetical protein